MSEMVLRVRYGAYAERLKDAGLTQGRLAEIVGVAPQHLSLVVLGRKPNVSAAVAMKIAAALDLSMEELFELVPAASAPAPKGAAADLVMAPA